MSSTRNDLENKVREQIDYLMDNLGYSLRDVSRLLGVSVTTIWRVKTRKSVSTGMLLSIWEELLRLGIQGRLPGM